MTTKSSEVWQQTEADLGEAVGDLRRRLQSIAAVDRVVFGDAVGMDQGSISNALSGAVRSDGRRKSVIPIEAALTIVRLPMGETIAELIAEQAGYMVVPDEAPVTDAEYRAAAAEVLAQQATSMRALLEGDIKRTVRKNRREQGPVLGLRRVK